MFTAQLQRQTAWTPTLEWARRVLDLLEVPLPKGYSYSAHHASPEGCWTAWFWAPGLLPRGWFLCPCSLWDTGSPGLRKHAGSCRDWDGCSVVHQGKKLYQLLKIVLSNTLHKLHSTVCKRFTKQGRFAYILLGEIMVIHHAFGFYEKWPTEKPFRMAVTWYQATRIGCIKEASRWCHRPRAMLKWHIYKRTHQSVKVPTLHVLHLAGFESC